MINVSVFKTFRKVQKFGDSLALTIPSTFVKVNELTKGTKVKIMYDLEGTLVLIKCENKDDFIKCLRKFIEKIDKKNVTI